MSAGAPLRAADRAARLAAQTEFLRPVVLEAGAGTGKTATLVARIVAWCLGGGWGAVSGEGEEDAAATVLDGVVAITFTEAAAAEMAARVGAAFADLAEGRLPVGVFAEAVPPDSAERRTRARLLLANLDRLTATTIHAYCRRLLAEHPVEARLHPQFEVDAEAAVLEEVVRDVTEDGIRAAYARGEADPLGRAALDLAGAGRGPREIADALLALAGEGVPAAALERDPFDAVTVRRLLDGVTAAAAALDAAVAGAFATARSVAKAQQVAAGAATLAARGAGLGLDGLKGLVAEVLDDTCLTRLKAWAGDDFTKSEREALAGRTPAAARAAAGLYAAAAGALRLDPAGYLAASRVLAPLLATVHEELHRRGVVTFQGLLADAHALLAGAPAVCDRVRRRTRQLLVDEFQDTDPLQCEIVELLALSGPADERPGLFIVGDPKQSIYGWRNADLAAYEAFVHRVLAGGEPLRLTVNFRSRPAILEEVERIAAPVMVEEAGVQPRFEPLLPCEARAAEASAGGGGEGVEHWVSWAPGEAGGPGTTRGRATALEAEAIARDIRRRHDAGELEWHDAGLLLRATSNLAVYLRALQEAGVPYAVERDRSYFQRREIIEAAALVRAVIDPLDHLALVTALRSPLAGVPDAGLAALWGTPFPDEVTRLVDAAGVLPPGLEASISTALAAIPAGVPGMERIAGWEANLRAFLSDLAALRASFAAEAPDAFVERLRASTLLEATEAARYLGTFRIANLDRFFRQLLEALAGGGDVHAVLRLLRRSVAEERQAEEGRPREAAEDAVQVMTIHKAKGLDFRHVYVAELHHRSQRGSREEVQAFRHEGRWELLLFGAPSPGFGGVEDRRRRVEAAELVRTLYVAVTRARDRLVLAGLVEPRPLKGGPAGAACHADLLRFRPHTPDLVGAWDQIVPGAPAPELRDDAGVRWAFPGLEDTGGDSRGRRRTLPVASPEVIRADAARLAVLRAEAEARMARRFRGAVSAEAHAALAGQLHDGEGDAGLSRHAPPAGTATAVGTAVHAFFERFDLAAPPAEETARRRREAAALLAGLVPPASLEPARRQLEAVLDTVLAGRLWRRFTALGAAVAARELPVLLPPGEEGPVGVLAGAVDLLFRDPEDGAWVVADYKTDDVAAADLDARAAAYASQARAYARAVQDALGLEAPPRAELWFLRRDAAVIVGA